MLYLLTNPFTTQLGIYELSVKQAAYQLGVTTDEVNDLLDKFENEYGIIKCSRETNEIAIKNYLRHSIVKGGAHVFDLLVKEVKNVKNKDLIVWVFSHLDKHDNLNKTVRQIIEKYKSLHGNINYYNDNDNDNGVSYHNTVTNRNAVNNRHNNQYKQKLVPPTLEEIKCYIKQEALNIGAEKFYNHYAAIGWMMGSSKMQDWKPAVQKWALTEKEFNGNQISESGCNMDTVEDRIEFFRRNIPTIDD